MFSLVLRNRFWLQVTVGVAIFAPILFAHQITATTASPAAMPTRADVEQIVRDTLNGMNSFGWDEKNHGILINWRRPDPTQVQCRPGKCDEIAHPTRHDPLNDVRTLQSYYYESGSGCAGAFTQLTSTES